MKIAILSMQRIVNYGSVLQAYSLKELIQDAVIDSEVEFLDIDNQNVIPCIASEKYTETIPKMVYSSRISQKIKRKTMRLLEKVYEKKVLKFTKNILHVNFENNKKKYDFVIVGSDEVFNTSNGIRTQLYGDIPQGNTIITYAASCGAAKFEEIPKERLGDVKKTLKHFDVISVRDRGTEEYIKKLYEGEILHHLDPVLVGNLYRKPFRKVFLKKYLIVYAYGERIQQKEEIEAIQKFAKTRNLKTLALGGRQFWCDLYIPASPFRMLDYFYYADYVVTDTFHGTIFSIITKKQFVTIIRESNKNKLANLLRDLGLEKRNFSDLEQLEKLMNETIDYKKVEDILKIERKRTQYYLKEHLRKRDA